jgi:predicted membrane GTPase involved in stress response
VALRSLGVPLARVAGTLADDLEPLFDALESHIPAPEFDAGHPLQARPRYEAWPMW